MDEWLELASELTVAGLSTAELHALADGLRALYQAGRARWSSLPPLPPVELATHLALHLSPDEDRLTQLRALVAEDLYLACACAIDLPGAVAAFDEAYLSRVPAFVARVDPSPAFADEIRQILRERLLVRRPDRPPRIAEYAGRGALMKWMRVVAVRTALDQRTSAFEARRSDDELADELAVEATPELALLHAAHAPALAAALRSAVANLAPEQRVILRLYFAAGQTVDEIAATLVTTRSTASRRLIAAREAVYQETRRILSAELPLNTEEFASLAGALGAELDVSLRSLLAEPGGDRRG
jgi:RNA polymerase sigma-70 factor (ECF subfamily)